MCTWPRAAPNCVKLVTPMLVLASSVEPSTAERSNLGSKLEEQDSD